MLKKLIKYTDFNGVERSENFYFNLTESELMDIELETVGGFQQMIQLIIDKQDIPKIVKAFKKILMASYGEKSADGRRFVKSKELSDAFAQTGAYNVLYMELISDANAAAAFLNSIVPEEISARASAAAAEDAHIEAEAKQEVEAHIHLLDDGKDDRECFRLPYLHWSFLIRQLRLLLTVRSRLWNWNTLLSL